MKTFRSPLRLATIIVSSLLWSCQEDLDISSLPRRDLGYHHPGWYYRDDRMTVLGKRLNNPYTVDNMRAAWASLVASDPSLRASDIRIFTSHLYIRFKPRDEEERYILSQDLALILYPFPLDYEIVQGGGYYRDPKIPKGQLPYQYCSVPVGKVLPSGVEYELLAEAFIPEEVEMRNRVIPNGRVDQDDLTDALVYESRRLTGNLDSPPTGQRPRTVREIKSILPSRWRPAGRIRAWSWDDGEMYASNALTLRLSIDRNPPPVRPLEGVPVQARVFLRVVKGVTDVNGEYRGDDLLRYKANYSTNWGTDPCYDGGPVYTTKLHGSGKRREDWNLEIGKGELDYYYVSIYRGAFGHLIFHP